MSVNNEWRGIGNLGADPVLRTSGSGSPVTSFSIATDRQQKRKNPVTNEIETVKVPDWITIVCWGPLAQSCVKYLKKGSLVAVTGELRGRSYEDESGRQHRVQEVRADHVRFLSGTRTPEEIQDATVENTASA